MTPSFNLVILFLHIIAICGLSLVALRIGKEAMMAWIAFLAVVANMFVIKQINLISLNVTTSDSIAVGMLFSLNLIQEYFGKNEAKKAIWISFFITVSYLILGWFQIVYHPNEMDNTQVHFVALISPMPRIIAASLSTFLIVQFLDVAFFSYLRKKTSGRLFLVRTLSSLILSQTVDTILFSFLGLYGLVESVLDILFLSLVIKLFVIVFSSPFIVFSKKFVSPHAVTS